VLDHGLDDTAFDAATLTAQRPLMFTDTGLVQFKNIFDNVGYTARGHRSLKSWALFVRRLFLGSKLPSSGRHRAWLGLTAAYNDSLQRLLACCRDQAAILFGDPLRL
jgi:hypothetical protein